MTSALSFAINSPISNNSFACLHFNELTLRVCMGLFVKFMDNYTWTYSHDTSKEPWGTPYVTFPNIITNKYKVYTILQAGFTPIQYCVRKGLQ